MVKSLTTTKTEPERNLLRLVAGGLADAGNWTWPNRLDQFVDVVERAVARRLIPAAMSDLTGN